MRIWLEKTNYVCQIKYLENASFSKQGTFSEIYNGDFKPEYIKNRLVNMIMRILKDDRLNEQSHKVTSFSELEFCEELQPYANNIQSWFCGSTVSETPDLLKDL